MSTVPGQLVELSKKYDQILDDLDTGKLSHQDAILAIAQNRTVDASGAVWSFNTEGELTRAAHSDAPPVAVKDGDYTQFVTNSVPVFPSAPPQSSPLGPPVDQTPTMVSTPPPIVSQAPGGSPWSQSPTSASTEPFNPFGGTQQSGSAQPEPMYGGNPSVVPPSSTGSVTNNDSVFPSSNNTLLNPPSSMFPSDDNTPPWMRNTQETTYDDNTSLFPAGNDPNSDSEDVPVSSKGSLKDKLPSVSLPGADGFVGRNKYLLLVVVLGILLVFAALSLGGSETPTTPSPTSSPSAETTSLPVDPSPVP